MPRVYAKGFHRRIVIIAASGHRRYSCCRCGRRLWKGERVTITVESPDIVTYKHTGRTCPKPYNPRPL